MNDEERQDDPFRAADKEEYADRAFEQAKKNEKCMKLHVRHGALEQLLDQFGRRAQAEYFEKSKPEKDDKQSNAGAGYGDLAEEMNRVAIQGLDRHTL